MAIQKKREAGENYDIDFSKALFITLRIPFNIFKQIFYWPVLLIDSA
uniref:Photosystem II protein M n=1 Tax=Notholaena standleyi TaxID=414630 RepID=A0A3G5CP07_9MONI|nr:photosystem II protein M [Notholaena standleyi]AYW14586.1 photosystem II protein M [Notholaena standleyi]